MANSKKIKHKVLIGLNYPPNRRAEPGDVVDDIPDFAVHKLEHGGVIERVEPKKVDKE